MTSLPDSLLLLLVPFVIILGPILASYFTAQIMRQEKLTKAEGERSLCDHCGHRLEFWDLIPLVSYLIQRGKCRYCHKPIDVRMFYAELMGLVFWGILGVGLLGKIAETTDAITVVLWLVFAAVCLGFLLYLAIFDLFTFSIPSNVLNYLNLFAVLVSLLVLILRVSNISPLRDLDILHYGLLDNLVMALIAAALMGVIIAYTQNQGMGIGDLFLATVIALMLGWPESFTAFYAMLLSASLIGLIYCWRIKSFKGVKIPLVPFMVFGYVMGLVFGQTLSILLGLNIFTIIFAL